MSGDLRADARGREGRGRGGRPAGARLHPAVRRGRHHGHGHPRAERDPGRARGIGRAGAALRAVLRRDDDYRTGGKPAADWDDAAARVALVDALARDGEAVLTALEGEPLAPPARGGRYAPRHGARPGPRGRAGRADPDRAEGRPDRVISTVDPDTRHGHKTQARGFDGYKGHVALDPDAELVTATAVTPGNAGDASVALALLGIEIAEAAAADPPVVYGDAAYGTGPLLEALEQHGAVSRLKVQPASGVPGHFTKDDFAVDLAAGTVTCPAGRTAPLIRHTPGFEARFRSACATCPLAARCTTAVDGRRVRIGPHEARLAAGRAASRDPAWLADYRATGTTSAQIAGEPSCWRTWQRGWNRQPDGGLTGLGTSPLRMTRLRRSSGSGTGMADMRASV